MGMLLKRRDRASGLTTSSSAKPQLRKDVPAEVSKENPVSYMGMNLEELDELLSFADDRELEVIAYVKHDDMIALLEAAEEIDAESDEEE